MRDRFRSQSQKSAFDRALQWFAKTRLGGKLFITAFPAIDRRIMHWTGGRLRMGVGQPVLLLHATGARSGRPRVTPLLYTPRGDGTVLLVASKAGATTNPAWYHNVIAHPDVEIEVDGESIAMRARELTGPDREAAWLLVNDNYAGYDAYRERAGDRTIPVILLEPR